VTHQGETNTVSLFAFLTVAFLTLAFLTVEDASILTRKPCECQCALARSEGAG
jgi:hypothetical protein